MKKAPIRGGCTNPIETNVTLCPVIVKHLVRCQTYCSVTHVELVKYRFLNKTPLPLRYTQRRSGCRARAQALGARAHASPRRWCKEYERVASVNHPQKAKPKLENMQTAGGTISYTVIWGMNSYELTFWRVIFLHIVSLAVVIYAKQPTTDKTLNGRVSRFRW